MLYTKKYFQEKFEAIPEDEWTEELLTWRDDGKIQRCVLGHCGITSMFDGMTSEVVGLVKLLGCKSAFDLASINDNDNPKYPQPTPKQRILAAVATIPDDKEVSVV